MQEYSQTKEPIEDLATRIKVKRGIFSRDWVDVKTYEFTNDHCIVKTDEIYELNGPITLSFHLSLAINDIVIEDFVGKVLKKKKDCSCFHYYIEFNNGKSSEGQSVFSKIKQISSIVKKKQNIKEKKNTVIQRNTSEG